MATQAEVQAARRAARWSLWGLPRPTRSRIWTATIHYGETVLGAFSYHPTMHALALDVLARAWCRQRVHHRALLACTVNGFRRGLGEALKVLVLPRALASATWHQRQSDADRQQAQWRCCCEQRSVIVGNRNFFPDQLVTEARTDILDLFGDLDIACDARRPDPSSAASRRDALKCPTAEHAEIDGVLVVLPNFGDERGVAETVQLSGLDVPILVQAYPDNLDQFTVERRRDAFCGKISVCNNLGQYGIPFSLTELHTVHPKSASFRQDLDQFLGVCRVVNGLHGARLGAIGAGRRRSTPCATARGFCRTTASLW